MSESLELTSMDPVKLRRRRLPLRVPIEDRVENQKELLYHLLGPIPETVLHVEPDCLRDLSRLRNVELLHQIGGIGGVASGVGTDTLKGIQGDDKVSGSSSIFRMGGLGKTTPKVSAPTKGSVYTTIDFTSVNSLIIASVAVAGVSWLPCEEDASGNRVPSTDHYFQGPTVFLPSFCYAYYVWILNIFLRLVLV